MEMKGKNMTKSKDFEVNPKFKKEFDTLTKIFKQIPPDKIKVASGLIENAAFTRYVLSELQETIFKEGSIAYDASGNIKESPAVKSYSTLINRYSTIVKELLNLLPKQEQPAAKEDALTKFLSADAS